MVEGGEMVPLNAAAGKIYRDFEPLLMGCGGQIGNECGECSPVLAVQAFKIHVDPVHTELGAFGHQR
ncbi:hypothetical protein D3C81_1708610 [compost metagenome]